MTTSTPPTPNRAQRRTPQQDHSPALRRYVTLQEAGDYLGVTERTIRAMIADGRLTGYRMGKRFIRLNLDEIDQAMIAFGGGVA